MNVRTVRSLEEGLAVAAEFVADFGGSYNVRGNGVLVFDTNGIAVLELQCPCEVCLLNV